MNSDKIYLVYDNECPACKNYLQILRIRETVADIEMINARESHWIIDEITEKGLDLDEGMVLKIGDELYYGADAINKISLISSPNGLFNKINYFVFKSKSLSRIFYPILVTSRALLLKILKIKKIQNLQNKN